MARIVIIGGGHNGLVCAFYLARAGHQVTIFERSNQIGGACRNEKWPSGAIVSPGANHFGMLGRQIADDMGLWQRGLSIVRANPQLIVGLAKGKSVALFDDYQRTYDEIAAFSPRDADALTEYFSDIAIARKVLRRHLYSSNPSLSEFVDELRSEKAELDERFVLGSIKRTLDHYFEAVETKAVFSATGFLYSADPDEPGTAFALLYLSLFDTHGVPGWGIPIGGMGRVVELMERAVNDAGAKIIVNQAVVQIETHGSKAVAVKCSDESVHFADYILSNADPYTTFVTLAGQQPNPLKRWEDSIFGGPCAKFNFVYRGTASPTFIRPSHIELLPKSAYVLLPSVEYAQAAFHSSIFNGYSDDLYFEFVTPSQFDDGLCSAGLNIGSIYCLFANYDALSKCSGAIRDRKKEEIFLAITAKLGIDAATIVEVEKLDPIDIEQKFGMHKGNVDHGSPTLSNIFEHRNVDRLFGIDNLGICGAGSHPGGLVTGIPGFNAAHRILNNL